MKNRTIVVYLDKDGNEVEKDKATKMNILELDENGNRIRETFMQIVELLSEEKAKEYWDNFLPELNDTKPQKKSVFCHNCGGQLNDNAEYCPNCGQKIELPVVPVEESSEP